DYSKPSHEGYKNTIELPEGNNVVPLLSDTIRTVQDGCSFLRLWFEDPNQHLKDFLKIVNSLDLNGDNEKRTRMHLFYFSFRDQASNWLKRLPAGSISTCGPHDTQYCMENLNQAFVEYASLRIDEAGGKWYTFKPEQNNLGDTYNPSWKSHPNLRWNQVLPFGIVRDVEVHIGRLKLLNDFYVIELKKDPETPLLVGSGFLATSNTVIDCRKAKISIGEGITRSVFIVKGIELGEEEAPY
nr:zinc finger, CCHC-type [Tanacetum cinerariifolium]